MAKKAYIGVSNVAKNIKKMYVGVNGVAKKVKKGYVGVNNIARLFFAPVSGTLVFDRSITDYNDFNAWEKMERGINIGDYLLFCGGRNGYTNSSQYERVSVINKSFTRCYADWLSRKLEETGTTSLSTYAISAGGYGYSYVSSTIHAYNSALTQTTGSMTYLRRSMGSVVVNDSAYFVGGTNVAGDNQRYGSAPVGISKVSNSLTLTEYNTYTAGQCCAAPTKSYGVVMKGVTDTTNREHHIEVIAISSNGTVTQLPNIVPYYSYMNDTTNKTYQKLVGITASYIPDEAAVFIEGSYRQAPTYYGSNSNTTTYNVEACVYNDSLTRTVVGQVTTVLEQTREYRGIGDLAVFISDPNNPYGYSTASAQWLYTVDSNQTARYFHLYETDRMDAGLGVIGDYMVIGGGYGYYDDAYNTPAAEVIKYVES